jgi:hypothetical protein
MAMSPGRIQLDPQESPPSRYCPVEPANRTTGIVPAIVTKSGQQQMDFLAVWQASRETLTGCLNVHILPSATLGLFDSAASVRNALRA